MIVEDSDPAFKLAPSSTHHYCSQEHSLLCGYCGHCHCDDILAIGIVCAARSGRQRQMICPDLPLVIHQDDIVQGRIDVVAVRRREEAELNRLIAASQKPCRPAPRKGESLRAPSTTL